LGNIFKELRDDVGSAPPNGDLHFWARQGVLLLNDVLTVPAGDARGHRRLGWQKLVPQVLEALSDRPRALCCGATMRGRRRSTLLGMGIWCWKAPIPRRFRPGAGFSARAPFPP
jgi:uracil-DNA glycosylase